MNANQGYGPDKPVIADTIQFLDAKSMGASFNSDALNVEAALTGSIEVHSDSDTRYGLFKFQVSNSKVNWTDFIFLDEDNDPVSALTVTAAAAFDAVLNLADVGEKFVRCVFTRTDGAGDMDAWICRKRG